MSIERAKADSKIKGVSWDELEEEARQFVLSFYSLQGEKRSELVKFWLKNKDILAPSLPPWAERELRPYVDVDRLVESLKKRTVWIRVNTLKADQDKTIKELEGRGVVVEEDNDFPYLYKVIETKVRISSLEVVKNFSVIIQDKASVVAVEELRPERGDNLIDMSSSPGNKLSLFAMLTDNQFNSVAIDVDYRRLNKEIYFLKQSGVNLEKVSLVQQDSTNTGIRHLEGIDKKVLLDAPCSSSGMIYNDPSILISLRDKRKVERYSSIQRKLFKEVYEHLKPSLLVYSVCSLFPEEGEEITRSFSAFSVPLKRRFSPEYAGFGTSNGTRLFPHIEHTEGFYINKFNLNR